LYKALNFENELELLDQIRKEYGPKDVVIRVDANGAFSPVDALEKLKRISEFDVHSIEQPIAINQHKAMRALCDNSPLPIALDEELIGHFSKKEQENLILIGGFKRSDQWIEIAESHGIGWWVTSALESNIGLNAIAQWTYKTNFRGHQGLGTGSLFSNNIASPLVIKRGCLWTDKLISWGKLP
jgi:L-alanine-DL-glutamate epimerase-like enolase superfamily enzyme